MIHKGKSARHFWQVLLVIGSTILFTACVEAGQDLPGNWAGSIKTPAGTLLAVNLTIGKLTPGAKDTRLHFGAPRSCDLNAEYSGMEESKAVFSFTNSDGGYCDYYFPGTLVVSPAGKDQVHFEMNSQDKSRVDAGELKRVNN
jgi:hypothetical protein